MAAARVYHALMVRSVAARPMIALATIALPLTVAAWVSACSGAADTGVSCLRLTCPIGFEADLVGCTCTPRGGTSGDASAGDGGACATSCDAGLVQDPSTCACLAASGCGACPAGQACRPSSDTCEASPGGGAIRSDLVGKEMSIGINNNSDGPPQGIREAHLDFNWQKSPLNAIVAVAVPPGRITVDGSDTSASEWSGVPVTTLTGFTRATAFMPAARRTNGTATDMTSEDNGVTTLRLAAAYDGSNIYFRAEWDDPTDNSARGRWIWNGTKWVRDTAETQPLPPGNLATSRPVTGSEDKLSLLFNINVPGYFGDNGGLGAGCANLCHLEGKDGSRVASATTTDAGTFYAGSGLMHANGAGHKVDLWVWKSTKTNPLGIFDDQVIDEVSRHGDANQGDELNYTGGTCTRKSIDGDRYPAVNSASTQLLFGNEYFDDVTAGCPSLGPSRVPSPYTSGVKSMAEPTSPLVGKDGTTSSSTNVGGVAPTLNDTIPGYIYRTNASTTGCLRCQNQARGKWTAGKWVVELRRSLVAPDGDDVDFTIDQR